MATSRTVWLIAVPLLGSLAYANWVAATEPIETSGIVVKQDAALAPAADDAYAARPPIAIAALRETLARPLFNDDRRPAAGKVDPSPQASVATMPAAATALSELKLLGTMQVEGAARKALIQGGDGASAQWIGVGEDVGGWRLTEITVDSVSVSGGGEEQSLRLYAPVE